MSDLLSIGVSGLIAAQKSLSTTSHNIANVNTDGYSRQRVESGTRDPSKTGAGFFGNGVQINDVTRVYDNFLTTEIRDSTAAVNQFDQYQRLASQVDNLLADPQGSMSPAMQEFFNAVQDVSNTPASIPARQSLLTSAGTLVDRVTFFNQRLQEQYNNVSTQLDQQVAEINSLATSIADLNRNIVDLGGNNGDQVANDLLDRRDAVLEQLAKLVAVKTVNQDDGTVSVFIGSGQVLVNSFQHQNVTVTPNEFDSSRPEVGITVGTASVPISTQISGGNLAGVLKFRNEILDEAKRALGRLTLGLTREFNEQHRLGMDLNGELGEDFFSIDGLSSPAINALASDNNASSASVSFLVTDTRALTTSDYRLTYDGSNQFRLRRSSDGQTTMIDASSGYPYTAAEVDGVTITIDSAPTVRDSYSIQPTFSAMSSFSLVIDSAAKVAAASPIRTKTDAANTGASLIDAGTVSDRATYVADTYHVYMADGTTANANGAIGTITDNNADSTLQYELAINGYTIYTQTEAGAPLADKNALAAAINGVSDANVAVTGVKAYVDAITNKLYLINSPATALPITVTETLNTTAGTVENGDTVTGYFGGVLTGVTTPTNTVTYTPVADSTLVLDSSDAVVLAGTYTDGGTISFNGIDIKITGRPNLGDGYTVESNLGGISDNRNALSLAALQRATRLENSTASYQDAYGQLVATVGTRTHQATLNFNAQDALLNNALTARSAVSGVNLDEEATDMLRYQQTYQAAAHVISAADRLFQALLGVLGG